MSRTSIIRGGRLRRLLAVAGLAIVLPGLALTLALSRGIEGSGAPHVSAATAIEYGLQSTGGSVADGIQGTGSPVSDGIQGSG